jgi:signal transduction histidine kinase
LASGQSEATVIETAELRLLIEMGRDLLTHRDLDELLQQALSRAMEFSAHDGGSILLVVPPGEALEVHAAAGVDAAPVGTRIVDLRRSVAGRVLIEREPLILEGRAERLGIEWRAYTKPIPSAICLPLLVSDTRAIGVLVLKSTIAARRLDPDEVSVLQLLAAQLAAAIENARLHEERDRLLAQLAERDQQRQALIERLLTAHEEERRRIAYELHDGLAQLAASAHQHLQSFADRYRPRRPEARQELQSALELARRAVRETRRIISGLRPTTLDDFGLSVALRLEIEALWSKGWEITYDDQLAGMRMPPAVETTLFRVAQEALNNVRRHARTTKVHIALQRDAHTIQLSIRDWGCGFDASVPVERTRPGERMGLLGMYEHVATVGGRCEISSATGAGTEVRITIPLDCAAPGAG